jgi:aminoglycoside 6'-N-acetyltransferase
VIDRLPHRAGRVTLRTLRVADLDAFLAFRAREDVARFQGWSPLFAEQALDFLRQQAGDGPLVRGEWRQIGIARAEDDLLIGDLGILLSEDGTTVEIGISVHPDHQGAGLGTEATRALIALLFGHPGVHRVVAVTDARNESAQHLLARVGMRRTGTRSAVVKEEACVEHEFATDAP